ncbi:restriction endonuclease subunit S [Pseudomonas aeruginosa]|uniref:restriction endonuclease subunit S n=1 Tax=Pseudomonas aeruginosa TaxID=287 RepID=UPI0021F1DD1E|nr:restriction endonuclease subunit S [Pseudomonas aeruginosa]MCV6104761.1 restriction endonuclease subunit S [Pseudomonas aeruginosa]MDI2201429.1 restriction endonuclease subunit S [Pseudomonas aeruginosa]HBO3958482.1 restriction endonuclease subunit S [Pseudomonas aeruginosa]HCF6076474.1 restriction endonuclease subunit S [Pseudomonas aeruginosa]HEP8278274.1 restriction endonuclease subunit S [Pseudomonas aeruginosa]
MSDWQTMRIGDLGRVVTGKTPPSSKPEMFDGDIPFITPSDMFDDQRHIRTERFVSAAWDSKQRTLLPEGAICVVCIGATIGKICMTSRSSQTNQQVNSVIVDPARFNSGFVYYAFRTLVGELKARATGAATPILNKSAFSDVTITVPPLETQYRIAEILGAYDDLIEVNRQRIAVLEEMARGLFAEWFIRLRFPGHEDVAIDDTPGGPLPVGWSWGTAGDLLLFDPRTRVPREGEKPFIPMGHLDTATSIIAEPEARTGNSGAKFQNGDTLFARITPCLENGKTGLVRNLPGPDGIGFGSTEFIVMRGGRVGPAFSYCLSRLPDFREHARMSMSGATGRQRARTDSVADFSIAIPPANNLFERFEKAAWPMLELVGQIGLSSERLAAARDLLLPRLISGQLSVTEAERELEAA